MPDESHSEPPLKGNSGTASPQVNPSETPQLNDEVKNYVQTLIDFNHSKAIKEAELEYKKSINAIESKIKPLDLKVTSVTKSYNDLSEKFEELGTKYNELKMIVYVPLKW